MKRYLLFVALTAGILSAMSYKVTFGDVSANEQDADVSLKITKFQVNDQTLGLSWKIVNNSDHDVWICAHEFGFDTYMAKDNRTLILRRRFDLPISEWLVLERPWIIRGLYCRLDPGQEHTESASFNLPVDFDFLFEVEPGNAERAVCLALEFGFFDEDLRSMILRIVEMAEKLDCTGTALGDLDIYGRFFGGLWIAGYFNGSTYQYFRESANRGGDEILMPPMERVHLGEKVLRATVEGVDIPYRGLPAADEPPQNKTEPARVTMALTGFDVNDTTLELCYKIKNNTDHDVWICNGFNRGESIYYFERYMDKDNKTLVLRRRYNLSSEGIIVERYPSPFRYLRLRPGQEKVESHSFTLPVTSTSPLFQRSGSGGLNVDSAQRLVIEIGFYDEDLRALILGVVDMAESLGCNDSAILAAESETPRLFYRFFGGFEIAGWFKNRAWFRGSVTSNGDEILMGHMHQALNGEQVLRIEADNLSIPFSIL